MEKTLSKPAVSKFVDPVSFNKHIPNLSSIKPDLQTKDILNLLKHSGEILLPFGPIDTFSCTKLHGKGNSRVQIDAPTFVDSDGAYYTTDTILNYRQIEMFFEPISYGITAPGTYHMEFIIFIEEGLTVNFELTGAAGSDATILNSGPKTLTGSSRVSLLMQNVSPEQVIFGSIRQVGGGEWGWLSTQVGFPPIVSRF